MDKTSDKKEDSSVKLNYVCRNIVDCKQGTVRAVRFNVDGSYCLTCGADRTLKLWNPHRSLLLKTYLGHGGEVYDAAGSCDNSQLCSGGGDRIVVLWDVATGRPLRRLRGHAGRINCICFNEESSIIVSGSQDCTVRCWDIRCRQTRDAEMVLAESSDAVTSLFVTDHEIVTGSLDGRVRRYDVRAGELVTDCVAQPVTCVSQTRDGQCVVVSGADSTVRLLDRDTGELLGEYRGHDVSGFTTESCVDNTDRHVLSGSADGHVYCWDLVREKLTETLVHGEVKGSASVVSSLSPHPLRSGLLSAAGGTVKLWGPEESPDGPDEA
ncbi:WD repeat domain-containing protein 83 [Schistocerca nitens]|uniref:WD repeat domain-containing protein 83 n=1 Tax=Schistocerca nitens TaxID=7011 RepID=UPI0021176BCD|nr:WD repeat domain-containing protein 83 [Schistocerca nitens]